MTTGKCLREFSKYESDLPNGGNKSLLALPDVKLAFERNGYIYIFDAITGKKLSKKMHSNADHHVLAQLSNQKLAIGLKGLLNTAVEIWDLKTEKRIFRLKGCVDDLIEFGEDKLACVGKSFDGLKSGETGIQIWDTRTGNILSSLPVREFSLSLQRIVQLTDGTLAAALNPDYSVKKVDASIMIWK